MSNIHIRDLTKRDYHEIDPLMIDNDVRKPPIKQAFSINGILLHVNIKMYFQQQNRIISHVDFGTTPVEHFL